MKKKIISSRIYSKHFDGDCYDVKVSDLPKDLSPTDIISIGREESY